MKEYTRKITRDEAIARLTVGTRIYYTGDMANLPANGVITRVWSSKFYSLLVDIKWDPEECNFGETVQKSDDIGLTVASFVSGPGTRFYFEDEWEAERRRAITEFDSQIAARK